VRYFFHTIENGIRTSDDDGVELPNDDTAKAQAAQFLTEMAADLIAGRGHKFGIEVKNESGTLVMELGLTVDDGTADWD
jgi:hypothetical protein